jgi:hypothetical protein
MARESKRHRDQRRFGKPGRLADLIVNTPPERWGRPRGIPEDLGEYITAIQRDIASCPVIEASNVAQFFAMHDREFWTYREDFPCSAPPHPMFFVEARTPRQMKLGGRIVDNDASAPGRYGYLFDTIAAAGKKIWVIDEAGASGPERLEEIEGARWYYRALPLWEMDGRPVYLSCLKVFPVDARGAMLKDPLLMASGREYSLSELRGVDREVSQFLAPCLLTISFLNCKNCVLDAVEPDRALNRERRKHGLKPFLRYHTINIEPMKKVLRTEGRIETEGLKRALHIVRGHFSTYTSERPLFGKIPGTFWIPSHARGSLEEGVVVSDYKVGAPGGTGASH